MKYSKTNGNGGASNPSGIINPSTINRFTPEETARCTTLIGYYGFDNRDMVELPSGEGILVFGSREAFAEILGGLGVDGRITMHEIAVQGIYEGLQRGRSYLLLPNPETGRFGQLAFKELISHFGDEMEPSSKSLAGVCLAAREPQEEPGCEIEVRGFRRSSDWDN